MARSQTGRPSPLARLDRARRRGRGLSDDDILGILYRAILEQSLTPGTKLGEEALCEIFDVSRARIRRVLLSLANREVVELHPNRGAFVARPSPREARHVFEGRRAIETTIVRRAAERIGEKDVMRLRSHLDQEEKARRKGDRRAAVKLSGDFHLLLAAIAGNGVLERFLANLVSRTSLIIALYGTGAAINCAVGEHREIVDALAARDGERAAALTEAHLLHIEAALRLGDDSPSEPDLKSILGSYL